MSVGAAAASKKPARVDLFTIGSAFRWNR